MPGIQGAIDALQRHWGFSTFRPGQESAVAGVLERRNVLAILPTGGGKSVCYQVPALLGQGLTIVVSPLIALMQDQVQQLDRRGISASYINSTLGAREIDQRWTDAEFGKYKLLYVAPERLQSEMFIARAHRLNVNLLAVDEAHCISEWGFHFRPSYMHLPQARRLLGNPPIIAVTATATPRVRRDILEHLALDNAVVVVRGFDRPNIVWTIFHTEQKRSKVKDVINGVKGPGILYTQTRKGAEEWSHWLAEQGETVSYYHAGMSSSVREAVQDSFLGGETRLIVATNAFGMGIDKPDVRFVIHVGMPSSLEGYYQEAGRGGRDGQTAYAVLLYRSQDREVQQALIRDGHPDAKTVRRVYEGVGNLNKIAVGSNPEEPILVDVDWLSQHLHVSVNCVKQAVELLVRQGTWQQLPPKRNHALIRFSMAANGIREYVSNLRNAALASFIHDLLRAVHADAFSSWWDVDLRILEKRTRLSRERLLKGLDFLKGQNLLKWHAPGTALRIQFNEARAQRLPIDDSLVRKAKKRADSRLEDMLRYSRSISCRRHFLLGYFGESSIERCGTCDICMGRHGGVVVTSSDEPRLRQLLGQIQDGELPGHSSGSDQISKQQLDGLLDWLVQEQYILLENPLQGKYVLTEKATDFLSQWRPRSSG